MKGKADFTVICIRVVWGQRSVGQKLSLLSFLTSDGLSWPQPASSFICVSAFFEQITQQQSCWHNELIPNQPFQQEPVRRTSIWSPKWQKMCAKPITWRMCSLQEQGLLIHSFKLDSHIGITVMWSVVYVKRWRVTFSTLVSLNVFCRGASALFSRGRSFVCYFVFNSSADCFK